ncbi:uncharacterized protein LOC130644895 [Hydractinia symbiolongicarpus]|uniref:uncharacterized protein LOC130644895 n=1 Tax=Hydractinia symbiolongicarpus TaxID=13093 RepID=UPI00254DBE10|nr:uncharacterized protein LOC130644895 [Hydractinia symbiolongicarpus]
MRTIGTKYLILLVTCIYVESSLNLGPPGPPGPPGDSRPDYDQLAKKDYGMLDQRLYEEKDRRNQMFNPRQLDAHDQALQAMFGTESNTREQQDEISSRRYDMLNDDVYVAEDHREKEMLNQGFMTSRDQAQRAMSHRRFLREKDQREKEMLGFIPASDYWNANGREINDGEISSRRLNQNDFVARDQRVLEMMRQKFLTARDQSLRAMSRGKLFQERDQREKEMLNQGFVPARDQTQRATSHDKLIQEEDQREKEMLNQGFKPPRDQTHQAMSHDNLFRKKNQRKNA